MLVISFKIHSGVVYLIDLKLGTVYCNADADILARQPYNNVTIKPCDKILKYPL